MSLYRLIVCCLGFFLLLLAGCGGSSTDLSAAAPSESLTAAGDGPGYPGFPTADLGVSPTRRVSDDDYSVDGDGYLLESGFMNRGGDGSSHILVSGPGSLAWAAYGVEGLTGDRPVSLTLDVEAAEYTAGDGEFLPVQYWVGVADFTTYQWHWFGEYDTTETVNLNSAELQDRFVSATGVLHCIIASPPTPAGGTEYHAVQVNTVTATTSPGYLQNLPHYAQLTNIAVGAVGGGHGASALSEDQYVNLFWDHVPAFGANDAQDIADEYYIYRRSPGEEAAVQIGTITAPASYFIDPTHNEPGVSDPVPGESYSYSVRAANEAGTTPWSEPLSAYIPVLPPTDVSATDGDYDDRVVVSWTAAEGATGYDIFRDDDGTPFTSVGEVTSWEDTSATYGVEYTYWVRTLHGAQRSQLSASDTGYAGVISVTLDPPADVSATDGGHADRVVLSWTKAEDATGYAVYRNDTAGDPFTTVGDVNTWDDTGATPGVVYTYWLRSTAGEASSALSASDTGYAGELPETPDLVHFPPECYPDTDTLSIIHADPVVRRGPEVTYDFGSGGFIPSSEPAYNDILKTNGYEFTLSSSGGIWPRVAIVETDDPATITSYGDCLPGIVPYMANTHRLTLDIAVLTVAGGPGDPAVTYSYKVFNADGTSAGDGTFVVHPSGSGAVTPAGVDWAIDVWDRESREIADRTYTDRTLDGTNVYEGNPTPEVLWFEFTNGWYFDADPDNDGVYASLSTGRDDLCIRFENTSSVEAMYTSVRPVIAGIGTEGAVIAIWTPAAISFLNPSVPGWPGVFSPGETYSVSIDDPHFAGIEHTYSGILTVVGINPNL